MIICEVNKNHLNVRTRELLTAGSQNVNTVEFRFNAAWDGLAKTATFKTSKKTISVLLNTNTTAIPWEALADAGEILAVGVFGVSGETIVLPTVWGILGKVMDAAHLGDEEKEPTPDVYQKILDELNALERPTWDALQNKPFSTLGGGLSVDENGVLSAEGGGPIATDKTLTQSGMAADAKVVGDRLDSFSKAIADLQKGGMLTVETITVDDSGETETIPVTGITLDYTSISLNIGESMQLAASITPSNATNTAVEWESSADSIATVVNGYVTAVSAGSAVITAKSVENPSITETCAVVVAEETGGGGDAPTGGKVQLSTHNIVDGSCIKKNGSVVAINNTAHYVEIPYSDGMFVSTGMNKGWLSSYPPFLVLDNGTYTKPDYATGDLFAIDGNVFPYQYFATLTGFSNGASVFVNMYYTAGADIAAYDAYYYIPGGAE